MKEYSLDKILSSMHDSIQSDLKISHENLNHHPVVKGEATETAWLKVFQNYLPKRYQAETAHIVDSKGKFSEQIDIVIFDRQYSPFIFKFNEATIIPAESVYAVFEVKQKINSHNISYAQRKVKSVRRLHRTSLPIPHAGGTYKAKPPIPIYGGILVFESEWNPALGSSLQQVLEQEKQDNNNRLDLGCVLSHGYFHYDKKTTNYKILSEEKSATLFLFFLISQLQLSGTVPMIDIQSYSSWLSNKK